jgi:hypothetical protein
VPGGGDFGCHHFRIFHSYLFVSWREVVPDLGPRSLCCLQGNYEGIGGDVKDGKSSAEKESPGPRARAIQTVRQQQANRSTGWNGFAKCFASRIVPMVV